MTMPNERTRSVIRARDFLTRLLLTPSAGGFRGVSKEVREEAGRILRHFPWPMDLMDPDGFDESVVEDHYKNGRDMP